MNLPKPACRLGYTEQQVISILGNRLAEFDHWMNGQTMGFCDGSQFNWESKQIEVACDGVHHGSIVYAWDLERFLAGLPVID